MPKTQGVTKTAPKAKASLSPTSPNQKITVFSNGVADFHRLFDVAADGPTNISIPVKTTAVGDILDSIDITGVGVRIEKPASGRASNDNAGSLELATSNVFEELATKLSGSDVKIKKVGGKVAAGKLVGTDTETHHGKEADIEVKFVVVLSSAGVERVAIKDIEFIDFVNKEVREEVSKALQRNFQKIKKDSTFVDLTLAADQATQAAVTYTIPAAAWNMSYRLKALDDGFEFSGSAVVHNNTDEDWDNVVIEVVTGEPSTFSTDIADAKIPARQHVNIVKAKAVGSHEVEEGYEAVQYGAQNIGYAAAAAAAPMPASARGGRAMKSASMMRGLEMADAGGPVLNEGPSASFEQSEAKEVGDFAVFTSPSAMSVPAKRWGLIPVFQLKVAEAKTVLHYKQSNHKERPFRAIQFTNETPHALGRGPAVIRRNGIYEGKCVLPATKKGEKALLPHALETGVKVRPDVTSDESKETGLRIAGGFYFTTHKSVRKTAYHLKNAKDEKFEMYLDHDRAYGGKSEFRASVQIADDGQGALPVEVKETLANGVRFVVDVPAKAKMVVYVTETLVRESKATLTSDNFWSYIGQQIETDGPLVNDQLKAVAALAKQYEAKEEEISEADEKVASLTTQQERLRANLAHASGDQQTTWTNALGTAEDAITKLENETLPKLRREQKDIQKQIDKAIQSLSSEWKE